MPDLNQLLEQALNCKVCEPHLPYSARPILQVHVKTKVLIVSQAPGSTAHALGIPFQDPSGVRLRDWMGVNDQTFYDAKQVGILPMGFCYPGKGKSGDLPPRKECAPLWRASLLAMMQEVKLTLVIGQYAMAWHMPETGRDTLTQTIKAWRNYWSDDGPAIMPLPHPSPRNNIWLRKNEWFEADVVPALRQRVAAALADN